MLYKPLRLLGEYVTGETVAALTVDFMAETSITWIIGTLNQAYLESRLLARTRALAAEGWRFPADDDQRAATADFLSAGIGPPRRQPGDGQGEESDSDTPIEVLCRAMARSTGNTLAIVATVCKDVFDALIRATYGAVCAEERDVVAERMKVFWVSSMRGTPVVVGGSSGGGCCSEHERALLCKAADALNVRFEALFDRYWALSDLEVLPLEDIVVPPWHLTPGDIFLLGFAASRAADLDGLAAK